MPIPTQGEPMVRTTARERVYQTLQKWIVGGILLPEERLNDMELAQHFGVSRTPVREALQMLAEQKLVTMVPSSGTFVSPIDLGDMAYVYELLGDLQACAVERGMEKAGPGELEALREINRRFCGLAREGTAMEMIDEDRAFHHRIAMLGGNPYLTACTDQLMTQAHRTEIRFFRSHPHAQKSYEGHNLILRALEDRDLPALKSALRENWRISVE